MANIRTTRIVRVLVPTPSGNDSQTYADVQLVAGQGVTLSTVVTATNRAAVTITASGGGGGAHTGLTALAWTASGHLGVGSRLAGFDAQGAAAYYASIGVALGGTGVTSYTAGDMLYATGSTTLATTTSSATGRSILALGVPPTGYVLGNSGAGLAWIAATVYIAQVRIPDIAFVINHTSNPGLVIQSTGTIGGP